MSQPETGGKRACGLRLPPWYILVPMVPPVLIWVGLDICKNQVLEWKTRIVQKIKDNRKERKQKRQATEKEILLSTYASEDTS
jgi:hypothetical protein